MTGAGAGILALDADLNGSCGVFVSRSRRRSRSWSPAVMRIAEPLPPATSPSWQSPAGARACITGYGLKTGGMARPCTYPPAPRRRQIGNASPANPPTGRFGLAARDAARYLFATPKALATLGEDPSCIHPAAPPKVEDLLEATLKTRRALYQADERGVRLYAQIAASHAPRCLA